MRALLLMVLLVPAGCAATDPLYQPRLWRPNGANEANLRTMVADTGDLLNGAATPVADGAVAAAAVARYRADKVKALPDTGLAKITLGGTGAAAPTTATAPE